MPDTILHLDALLFDMDGTLVDSTAGVVGAWELFSESYPHIDVHDILSSAHGVRTVDNLRNYCHITDPQILESEAERFEKAIVSSSTKNGRQGIIKLPGVQAIIDELAPGRFLPNPRWAICTSATRSYATSALESQAFPFQTSLLPRKMSPRANHSLILIFWALKMWRLVFEDAPSGIRSGRAAGCKTVGLLTTHSREQVEAAQPDFIVKDLSSISVKRTAIGVTVTIQEN
ncbi:HAD-like domain-containing protein [Pholiota molesta]|nr:HAD-like domain-containing protein [Pholiota molesta]